MATILARATFGNKYLIEVASDPSAGAGTPAPIGSIAMLSSAGLGTTWQKTGAADTSWFRLSGPLKTQTKTANFVMTLTDRVVFCDTTGGAFTLTLFDPTQMTGVLLYVFDVGGVFNTNNLTLARFGTEKIEGLAANKILQTNWGKWDIVSDGTNWFIG